MFKIQFVRDDATKTRTNATMRLPGATKSAKSCGDHHRLVRDVAGRNRSGRSDQNADHGDNDAASDDKVAECGRAALTTSARLEYRD
jgi:hypothetical protein